MKAEISWTGGGNLLTDLCGDAMIALDRNDDSIPEVFPTFSRLSKGGGGEFS
jgi:hypothetical protein